MLLDPPYITLRSSVLDKSNLSIRLHQQSNMALYKLNDTREYTAVLYNFQTIRHSSLYLSTITSPFTPSATNEILFAMLNKKCIILPNIPIFNKDVIKHAQEIITKRMNKIIIMNLQQLDDNDLQMVLTNTNQTSINYVISKHEEILIKSYLKEYFRSLTRQ